MKDAYSIEEKDECGNNSQFKPKVALRDRLSLSRFFFRNNLITVI